MKKRRTVFLTGATGLVGSYLLKVLLERGCKVYALARKKGHQSAQERVSNILAFWSERGIKKYLGRLVVIEGDITYIKLKLNNKDENLLINEVDEIFHTAAVIEFNWPLELIRTVNVEGVRNLLDLATTFKNIKKINHISTAYICGDHKGIFTEDDLDVGQGFNTTYEQSKFEAEKVIQEYRQKGLLVDVFRLPFVVGESQTGKVSVFQDFYKIIRLWTMELFDIFPGKEIMMNIVPIDVLCKAIFAIIEMNITAASHTYHLFSPTAIALSELLDYASEYLGFKKPRLMPLAGFDKSRLTAVQASLLKYNIFSYNVNVTLDSAKTNKILKKHNLVLPKITRGLLKKLYDYPLKTGFFKNG